MANFNSLTVALDHELIELIIAFERFRKVLNFDVLFCCKEVLEIAWIQMKHLLGCDLMDQEFFQSILNLMFFTSVQIKLLKDKRE